MAERVVQTARMVPKSIQASPSRDETKIIYSHEWDDAGETFVLSAKCPYLAPYLDGGSTLDSATYYALAMALEVWPFRRDARWTSMTAVQSSRYQSLMELGIETCTLDSYALAVIVLSH